MPYTFMGETNPNVTVRPSNIAKAGDGLFAAKDFEKDETICLYFGVVVDTDVVKNGYYDSDYIFEAQGSTMIDAADPLSCFGRFINDGLSQYQSNCDFTQYKKTKGTAFMTATRPISLGEEIYTQYGAVYWSEPKRKRGLSTANKRFVKNGCIE